MRITYRKEQNDVTFDLRKRPEDPELIKELSFNNGRLLFKINSETLEPYQMYIASAREEVEELVYTLLQGAIEQTFRAHSEGAGSPLMDAKPIHLPGGGIHLVGDK